MNSSTTRRRLGVTGLVALLGVTVTMAASAAESPSGGDGAQLRKGQIVTVAGTDESGYSGDGHDATDARIAEGARIDVGPDGTLYIADMYNKRLRTVTSDGVIDTLEGLRASRSPETGGSAAEASAWSESNTIRASTVGPDGALYLATDEGIRRVDESGEHQILGGDGDKDFYDGGDGGDGGPATQASLYQPSDIAVGPDGDVYVADSNNGRIRRIAADGTITTFAGGGETAPSGESGAATEAELHEPQYVAVGPAGDVYVASGARGEVVSRITPDGTISTVVGLHEPGYAGDGGPAQDARISDWGTGGLAVDADGVLYLGDPGNHVVRQVDEDGVITSVGAGFGDIEDVAIGPDGNIYFIVRSVVKMFVRNPGAEPPTGDGEQIEPPWAGDEPGTIATVAGVERDPEANDGGELGTTDAELPEPALTDEGVQPQDVAVGPDGTVYFTARDRHTVGTVASDGAVEVIAGTGERGSAGDGGPAAESKLDHPQDLAVDDTGAVYIVETERVRMIDPDGRISTVAGVPASGEGNTAATRTPMTPSDVAVGPDRRLYVADVGCECIRTVAEDGSLTVVAGGGERWGGEADGAAATEASLRGPASVAVDADDNLYIIERGSSSVRMVGPAGNLTTIAGASYHDESESGFSGEGVPASQAALNTPVDVTAGPDGSVYVADQYNARVRQISPDGIIETLAGTGERRDGGDDGPANEAPIHEPSSVAVGPDGSVYLTSPDGGRIRVVEPAGTISTLADVAGQAEQDRSSAAEARLRAEDIAADPAGSLHLIDSARGPFVVGADGAISAPEPWHGGLTAIAGASDGSSYVTDPNGILRVYPDGGTVRVAGGGPGEGPPDDGEPATATKFASVDLALSPDDVLHILHEDGTVRRLEDDGTLSVVAEYDEAEGAPTALAVDGAGGVYIADYRAGRVVLVDGEGSVTTVAGNGEAVFDDYRDGDGGDATEATVNGPQDVAVDDDGTLYIADRAGVRRVDSGGTIMTLFEARAVENEDGTAVRPPRSVTLGSNGDVYFVDTSTEQVRVIVRADEVANPIPWGTVVGLGLLVLVVVGTLVGVWQRRRVAALVSRWRSQAA